MVLTTTTARDWPSDIGKDCFIGIVTSRFNTVITDHLETVCYETLAKYGVTEDRITSVSVPGALELPYAASILADRGGVDGIIALGCVIRGETYHFEVVSDQSAKGLMDVQLNYQLPVLNGILTVETAEQAQARVIQKAADAATGAIEMILWRQSIKTGFTQLNLP